MNTDLQTKWTIPLVDAGDGSGDAIINFPDDLLALMGWVEGDELSLDIVDNSIKFTKNPSI
ncbi:MAG: hypothetical protein U1C48_09820 [Methylotenera sp.]|nr:hypothetical protein [Methylotenera sp.]MDZ4263291.1 hypothetical protein [Pseudomonadota bacterium]